MKLKKHIKNITVESTLLSINSITYYASIYDIIGVSFVRLASKEIYLNTLFRL